MIITTLPIAYRPNRPFRILYTQYVASCIARLTDSSISFPLNRLGGLREAAPAPRTGNLVSDYQEHLEIFCEDVSNSYFFSDSDPEFVKFVSQRMRESLTRGFFEFSHEEVSYCECGRVEVPTQHMSHLVGDDRAKLVVNHEGVLRCTICGSGISTSLDKVLMTKPISGVSPVRTLQPVFRSRLRHLSERMEEQSMLISRSHRELNINITFDGLIVDPDYCWAHYIMYLAEKFECDLFCVVIGINQIKHAYRIQSLTELYCPDVKIEFVFTPLIQFDERDSSLSAKTTLHELGELVGSSKGVRLFLSRFINWDKEVSRINRADVAMVQKTDANKPLYSLQTSPSLDLRQAMVSLNSSTVVPLLKSVRQRKQLNPEQTRLYRSL